MTVYGDPIHVTVNVVCPATVCWGLTYPIIPPSTFTAGQTVAVKANITKLTNAGWGSANGQLCGLYIDGTRVATANATGNPTGGEVSFTFTINTAGAHRIVVSVEDVACNPTQCDVVTTECGTDMICENCGPAYCTLPTW